MSYDVDVYGRVSLTTREMVKVVSVERGLKAMRDRRTGTLSSVVRKKTGEHCFTVEGPMRLESDDIPAGRTDVVGSSVLYSIHVSYDVQIGSGGFAATADGPNLTSAMAFAKRLAERVNGTVIDLQTYEPPAPISDPEPELPKPRYLHVKWHRLRDDTKDLAKIYLRTARELFPPGVPTRFGTYEPMQGRFPRDDDSLFDRVYQDECRLEGLSFAGKMFYGSVDRWANDRDSRIQVVSLRLDLAKLEKARAVGAVEPFLTAVAERAGCFFAFVEVNSSPFWTTQPMGYQGAWGGLPTGPQWLTWFSPEYGELVRPYLHPARITDSPTGMLHRWTAHPVETDELRVLSGEPWIAAEFRGQIDYTEDFRGKCKKPASIMPPSLRAPSPGSP